MEFDGDARAFAIQGVLLPVALSGFGQHWKQHSQRQGKVQPTERFDNFLSHDWGTAGYLKFLSLLIRFNARAAMATSIVATLVIGSLRGLGVVQNKIWTSLFAWASFFLVLLFWQQLRRCFCRPRIVFLDRLCIPQDDAEVKAACIRGLADYLDRSDTLTVLWSERYFSRIWCVFEMATFLRHQSKRQSVEVVPVDMSVLTFLAGASWASLYIVYALNEDIENPAREHRLEVALQSAALVFLAACVIMSFFHHLGVGLLTKMQQLPAQLRAFDIRNASCYCCSVGHVDPHTRCTMPCDRALILAKVKNWYSDPVDEENPDCDDYLDKFNHLVRLQLAGSFLKTLVASRLLPLYVYIIIGMFFPVYAEVLGNMAISLKREQGIGFYHWIARICTRWLIHVPLQVVGVSLLVRKCWLLGVELRRSAHPVLVSIFLGPASGFFVVGAFYLPFRLCWDLLPEDSLVPAVVVAVEAVLVAVLFCHGRHVTSWLQGTAAETAKQIAPKAVSDIRLQGIAEGKPREPNAAPAPSPSPGHDLVEI